jgi:hypothetical protein
MDSIEISEQLKKLATDNEKRTKSSRLNDVFDDVENALKNGISRKSVIELLAKNGLELSPKSFESTLARLRKKRKNKAIQNNNYIQEKEKIIIPDTIKEEIKPEQDNTGLPNYKKRKGYAAASKEVDELVAKMKRRPSAAVQRIIDKQKREQAEEAKKNEN